MTYGHISGPHSALTDFLRENNIRARTVAVRNRGRRNRNEEENGEAGPSNANGASGGAVETNGHIAETEDLDSDGLDEPEDVEATQAAKRRKTSKGKGKEKASENDKKSLKEKKAAARKRARKRADSDDDDYEDSEEDEYTAPARSLFSPSKKVVDPSVRPPNGSFEECAECGKDFTVTRYTLPANPPPGWLCHDCAKASGLDPFKKPAPRKRKAPAERREVINFEEIERVLPLSTMCINIITQNLDSVEALGDIGAVNTDEILRVIASRRSLTPENAQLFYGQHNTNLILYDATNLKAPAFETLASLNPNLTSLRLDYCGQLTCLCLLSLGRHLPFLKRLELLGPFLVRSEAWKEFFETTSQLDIGGRKKELEAFLATQSPRFDKDCLDLLVERHPNLRELRLSAIGKMEDTWLGKIEELRSLTRLEIEYPARSLGDEAVVRLLEKVGAGLEVLRLSGNEDLTDEVLLSGVLPNCKSLQQFSLPSIPLLSDLGICKLFTELPPAPSNPIKSLDLSRNTSLSTHALTAIITYFASSETLTSLSINGWKDIPADTLSSLANSSLITNLTELDISWCRNVDNFIMKDVVRKGKKLKWVKCYGCNRLTENCPKRPGLAIYGLEAHTATKN